MDKESLRKIGRSRRQEMSMQELMQAGASSDNITFIGYMTDSKLDKDKDLAVVGYKLKANTDITYRQFDLRENFKSLLDCEMGGVVTVQAGQEFVLNVKEAIYLISQIEYDGEFTGGGVLALLDVKKVGDGNLYPIIKVKDKKVADMSCEDIRDTEGNVRQDFKAKFKGIHHIDVVKQDSTKDTAAAFRLLYGE